MLIWTEDKMKFKSKNLISLYKALALFFLAGALVACQSTLFTYRGTTAKPEISLPLKAGGSHDGTWGTYDLNVHYRYQRHGDTLKITGSVDLMYNSYTGHFFLRLHFLDNENKILDTKYMVGAGYRKAVERYPFTGNFQLPPATAAIAFSYDGEVGGTGDDGTFSFWMDPRRSGRFGVFY